MFYNRLSGTFIHCRNASLALCNLLSIYQKIALYYNILTKKILSNLTDYICHVRLAQQAKFSLQQIPKTPHRL